MGRNSGRNLYLKDEIVGILRGQGVRCAMTGEALSPDTAALDHMTPIGAGGGVGAGNLQVVTSRVNNAKGVMSNDEFVSLCVDVVAWQGRKDRRILDRIEARMSEPMADLPLEVVPRKPLLTEEEKEQRKRSYYDTNRAKLQAKGRAYYAKNKRRAKEYYAKNKRRIREYQATYRAGKRKGRG